MAFGEYFATQGRVVKQGAPLECRWVEGRLVIRKLQADADATLGHDDRVRRWIGSLKLEEQRA